MLLTFISVLTQLDNKIFHLVPFLNCLKLPSQITLRNLKFKYIVALRISTGNTSPNLNNYFDFHVCLSIRSSVVPWFRGSVRPNLTSIPASVS